MIFYHYYFLKYREPLILDIGTKMFLSAIISSEVQATQLNQIFHSFL